MPQSIFSPLIENFNLFSLKGPNYAKAIERTFALQLSNKQFAMAADYFCDNLVLISRFIWLRQINFMPILTDLWDLGIKNNQFHTLNTIFQSIFLPIGDTGFYFNVFVKGNEKLINALLKRSYTAPALYLQDGHKKIQKAYVELCSNITREYSEFKDQLRWQNQPNNELKLNMTEFVQLHAYALSCSADSDGDYDLLFQLIKNHSSTAEKITIFKEVLSECISKDDVRNFKAVTKRLSDSKAFLKDLKIPDENDEVLTSIHSELLFKCVTCYSIRILEYLHNEIKLNFKVKVKPKTITVNEVIQAHPDNGDNLLHQLSKASAFGSSEVIYQFLIDAGLDPTVTNDAGLQPHQLLYQYESLYEKGAQDEGGRDDNLEQFSDEILTELGQEFVLLKKMQKTQELTLKKLRQEKRKRLELNKDITKTQEKIEKYDKLNNEIKTYIKEISKKQALPNEGDGNPAKSWGETINTAWVFHLFNTQSSLLQERSDYDPNIKWQNDKLEHYNELTEVCRNKFLK